jgi:RNA polymerase sigma-70 factor (ECF subfamily)
MTGVRPVRKGVPPEPDGAGSDEAIDRELIARWLAGDQRAATTLVERHATALSRFAAAMGGMTGSDVDELVQDTFVRAFNSLESFRGESSLRTWLFTIERRLMLDRRRAERRRPEKMPVAEGDAASEYTALDGIVADEMQERVRVAVDQLTALQREVFTLRVTEGLSYKEIADIVGSTEGAARVHYHHAMRAVKEYLGVPHA